MLLSAVFYRVYRVKKATDSPIHNIAPVRAQRIPIRLYDFNSFPPNDTIIMVSSWSWSLHKLMGVYMGSLILGDIL